MTIAIRIACALVLLMTLGTTTNTSFADAQTETTYRPFKEMWAAKRANERAGPSTSHKDSAVLEVGEWTHVVNRAHRDTVNEAKGLEEKSLDSSTEKKIGGHGSIVIAASSPKSKESKVETEIVFINGLSEPVSVYWVDYKGKEVRYKILGSRGRYIQHTYVTHPWVVRRSSDNKIVGRAIGRVGRQTLEIRVREYRKQEAAQQDAQAWTLDTTYEPNKMMYIAKRANVRAGPSTSHEKVDLLEAGDRVYVVGRIGNWFKLTSLQGRSERFIYAPLVAEHKPATETTIAYANGDVYRGTVRDGRPHGRGVYTWANGASYDGEWNNGDFHGYGVRIYANGNRYEGEWRNHERNGRGIWSWPGGGRYEGDFVDGKRTGQAVYTWGSDGRYVGGFADGVYHGHGSLTWDGSDMHYEGDFVDGKSHGRGVKTWPDGSRYEGGFRNGLRHGRGVLTWANGNHYEGDFVRDKRTGRGVFTWDDGQRYQGDFVDGKRHGRGVYITADGGRHEGDFADGKLTNRSTYTKPGGQAWGAVAVETDPAEGPRHDVCQERGFHISVNFDGAYEAGADARTQCNAYGARCDVKKYFEKCAAYARGYIDRTDGGRYCVYGVGIGDSENAASLHR